MKERFGIGLVTDVLKRLKKQLKIKSFGFDNLSTYGIMSDYSKETIKRTNFIFMFPKITFNLCWR